MTRYVMHTRTSVAKADSAVHRLTDMLVEEVSLVDRAANQRKFLIVKRDTAQKGSEMPTEVTPNGAGGFTASGAAAKGFPPPKDDKDKTKKSKLEKLDAVPPGFKQMMSPLLSKASERLQGLADAVDKASEGEVDDDGVMPPVPADFIGELATIIRLLDQACSMWPNQAPAEAAEGEEPPPPGDEPPPDLEMREKAVEKLAKRLGFTPPPALVKKVGAKMSKERLSRFEAAIDTLGSLLGELRAASPVAAPAAKGKDEEEDTEKLLAKVNASVDGRFVSVGEALEKLTKLVLKQKQGLETVQKARPAGNSVPAETPVAKSVNEDVSWPLDMNSKFSRDKVNKAESFFDDD